MRRPRLLHWLLALALLAGGVGTGSPARADAGTWRQRGIAATIAQKKWNARRLEESSRGPVTTLTAPSRFAPAPTRFRRMVAGEEPLAGGGGGIVRNLWKKTDAEVLRPLEKASRRIPWLTEDRAWVASTTGLVIGESTYGATKMSPLLQGIRGLGIVGALGLTVHGAHSLFKAKTTNHRLDAIGDLAWGIEGVTNLGFPGSAAISNFGIGVGVVGGMCQAAVGCRRISQGIKEHKRDKIVLGALDLASGALWVGWNFGSFHPAIYGSYIALTLGREAWAHKDQLKALGQKVKAKTECALGTCKRAASTALAGLREKVGSPLRAIAASLARRPTAAAAPAAVAGVSH
jgi:hypothetical protein